MKKRAIKSGVLLLEVISALGIFAIVVIALSRALNDTINTSMVEGRLFEMRQDILNLLSDARIGKLKVGDNDLGKDVNDVQFNQKLTPLKLKNNDNESLDNLYNLSIIATWTESGASQENKAEIYVYREEL